MLIGDGEGRVFGGPVLGSCSATSSCRRTIEAIHAGQLNAHLSDLGASLGRGAPAGHPAETAIWAERAGEAALRALSDEEAARSTSLAT